PFAVNAVNPTRQLLIGTTSVYESNFLPIGQTLLTSNPIVFTLLRGPPAPPALPLQPAYTPPPGAQIGQVKSLVYGGFEPGGVPRPTVIYVGTSGDVNKDSLFVRQVGGTLVPVASWRSKRVSVQSVATDPTDWRRVYVLDANGRIW